MSKREKLLDKARQNSPGLTFNEFETLLKQCGWIFDRQKGSHRSWLSPRHKRLLPIQPCADGKAKSYQVKQALLIMEKENG